MNPILFSVGNINFYSFGIITLASVLVGFYISWFLLKKTKPKTKIKPVPDAIILIGLMGIIGARFTFFLLNYYKFNSFEEMFYYSQNGLVAWGGLISACLFCMGLAIKYQDDVFIWLDNLIIGFFGGFLVGNIATNIIDKASLIDYRIFWIAATLAYLFYLRLTKIKIKNKLNGFLYLFGILSFCLMQIILPQQVDLEFGFDFGRMFSIAILMLLIVFLIPIISKKSLRILVWQGWTRIKFRILSKR